MQLEMKDFVNYCFVKIQQLLTVNNFEEVYSLFIKSDIIIPVEYQESLLFDHFYQENSSKIKIKDKKVLKSLRYIDRFRLTIKPISDSFVKDLKAKLFENEKTSDISIISYEKKRLYLHKSILISIEYFQKLFKMNPDITEIDFDYSYDTLKLFFKSIYYNFYNNQYYEMKNSFKILIETFSFVDQICFNEANIQNLLSQSIRNSNSLQGLDQEELIDILIKYHNKMIQEKIIETIYIFINSRYCADSFLNIFSKKGIFDIDIIKEIKSKASIPCKEMFEKIESMSYEIEKIKNQK